MNLNNENIDELMFQLLEGEIQGPEREKLLEAIKADKIYSKQWDAWQQTVLDPKSELIVMDTGKLLKNKKKPVMIWWKYSAAAAVILFMGIGIYLIRTQQPAPFQMVDKPGNPRQQILPTVPPVNLDNAKNDTILTLKQKIEMMAGRSKVDTRPNNAELREKPNMESETERPVLVETYPEVLTTKVPENDIPVITVRKEDPVIADKTKDMSGSVIMTVYTEPSSGISKPSLNDKIKDKKNRISRIFSIPRIMIVNDSSTLTNKKVILENKEYKIIAGF